MRWKDCPEPQQPGMVPPGSEDKVMHMALRIGDTTVLASDGPCQGQQSFQGFALSPTVPNEAEADRKFAALADSGQVQMPLGKTFFSPRFGMVADRFGVWMYSTPARFAGIATGKVNMPPIPVMNPAVLALAICQETRLSMASSAQRCFAL
jgi:PhnB protein